MSSVQVVDPSGSEPPSADVAVAARPRGLAGLRVGVLDNGKSNAAHVVGLLARQLHRRFDAQQPVAAGKAIPSQPCPDEVLAGFRGFGAALVGVGDWGSCTSWSVHDSVELERRGIPTVLLCTDPFLPLARAVARQEGLESLAVVTIGHPIGGVEPERLDDVITAALDRVAEALLTAPAAGSDGEVHVRVHEAPGDVLGFLAFAEQHRFGDGLPLVPPTVELVDAAVASSGRDGDELVGAVPPSNRGATVRAVAANAVMAGCPAPLLPVVLAAVRACLQPHFNLQGLTTTTHPVTPLVVVHGPVVDELGFNPAANTLGQGNRANAGVGRALRLVLQNVGEARPGETDRATHGGPAKYSYCMAENAAASPFSTFHDDRGGGSRGAVTVIGGEGPHNVNDHGSTTAAGILRNVAGTMATLGSNNVYLRGQQLVVLSPEHAEVVARDGYDRRAAVVELAARARVDVRGISAGNLDRFRASAPHVFDDLPVDGLVPVVDHPEDVLLLVAGGPGKHSVVVPTFGSTVAATADVDPDP